MSSNFAFDSARCEALGLPSELVLGIDRTGSCVAEVACLTSTAWYEYCWKRLLDGSLRVGPVGDIDLGIDGAGRAKGVGEWS